MKPADLLRRINRFATRRGVLIAVSEGGNHTKVQLGDRRAVLPRHPKDLKPGTFHAILKQLGLTAADLED
jgi:hypothetical protein